MKKVTIVHVPYQHRGGEDIHVEVLAKAYQELGYQVSFYPAEREPQPVSLKTALGTITPLSAPGGTLTEWTGFFERARPDFLHLHNIFPTLGPQFLKWIIQTKTQAVMTVHNHRFYCTNGLALRDGKICKLCLDSPWMWRPAWFNCNDDRQKSIYHSIALTEIRTQNLYDRAISYFLAPSPYIREELKKLGISALKIQNLRNPVSDTRPDSSTTQSFDVCYAGRLSTEKGIENLLKLVAARPALKFAIGGGGPWADRVKEATQELKNLYYLGSLTHAQVLGMIQNSKVSILPSICNEILPTFVLESFYLGKRCVVPDLDSTRWLAQGEYPGILSNPQNPMDLARGIDEALAMPPIEDKARQGLKLALSFGVFRDNLGNFVDKLVTTHGSTG